MKHYRSIIVPAQKETTRQELEKITCDMCGNEIKQTAYSEEKVTVSYKTGNSYPEGGYGKRIGIDMCPKCFKTKLKPWIESKGCEFHTVDWDL